MITGEFDIAMPDTIILSHMEYQLEGIYYIQCE